MNVSAPAHPLQVTGHLGEWLQGCLGPGGEVALVSCPCPAFWVEPGAGGRALDSGCAARLAQALNLPLPKPLPALRATMPLGGGAGSSTAALVALARMLGSDADAATLARACAQAEGASDPLMFPEPERLLFAPRRGVVLDRLPPLPRHTIIGGFWGAAQRTDPADRDFPDIADLVTRWRDATALADFAALASLSAQRCTDHRGPGFDPTPALVQALGALGWLRAHTGSARGLIFAPGTVPMGAAQALTDAGFSQVVRFDGGSA